MVHLGTEQIQSCDCRPQLQTGMEVKNVKDVVHLDTKLVQFDHAISNLRIVKRVDRGGGAHISPIFILNCVQSS